MHICLFFIFKWSMAWIYMLLFESCKFLKGFYNPSQHSNIHTPMTGGLSIPRKPAFQEIIHTDTHGTAIMIIIIIIIGVQCLARAHFNMQSRVGDRTSRLSKWFVPPPEPLTPLDSFIQSLAESGCSSGRASRLLVRRLVVCSLAPPDGCYIGVCECVCMWAPDEQVGTLLKSLLLLLWECVRECWLVL